MTRDHVEVRNRKVAGKQQPSIEIYIQELILRGFAAYDHHRVGAAVERELTRLFAEQDVPLSLIHRGEVARLDGGVFEMVPRSGAEQICVHIAQAVYGALTR